VSSTLFDVEYNNFNIPCEMTLYIEVILFIENKTSLHNVFDTNICAHACVLLNVWHKMNDLVQREHVAVSMWLHWVHYD